MSYVTSSLQATLADIPSRVTALGGEGLLMGGVASTGVKGWTLGVDGLRDDGSDTNLLGLPDLQK